MKRNMRDLDVVGTFWKATNPDTRVSGRLTFDSAEGVNLNLIGSLHDPAAVLARRAGPRVSVPLEELYGMNGDPVHILGETTAGYVTLPDCVRTSANYRIMGAPRPAQESYQAVAAYLGAHLGPTQFSKFTGVTVRIHNLMHWIGMPAVRIEFDYDENPKQLRQLRIINNPRSEIVTESNYGPIELAFEYQLAGDHIVESSIKQSCAINVQFESTKNVEQSLRICKTLQDLVTIGLDAPVPIDRISFHNAETNRPIELYANIDGRNGESQASFHPSKMLFTFEGIGGLQGVAKWLAVADKYRPAVSVLLSPTYSPPRYEEHRFFDALTAVETLARIKRGEQHINRFKLKQLSHEAGDVFAELVGDVELWVDVVWDARNYNLVPRGLHEDGSPPLRQLAESLYFMAVLFLLSEIGASDDIMTGIPEHGRFQSLAYALGRK